MKHDLIYFNSSIKISYESMLILEVGSNTSTRHIFASLVPNGLRATVQSDSYNPFSTKAKYSILSKLTSALIAFSGTNRRPNYIRLID